MYEYDPIPFRRVFERDFGYLAGVARNAGRFADRPALSEAEGERSWTYGPEFALCRLAALRLGAIATPINFRLSAGANRACD